MMDPSPNEQRRAPAARPPRVWRLGEDVQILPVEDLPPAVQQMLFPGGAPPKGYFAIQRPHARTHPKVINQDVHEVLQAFGQAGATFAAVLGQLAAARKLDRQTLDAALRQLVATFVQAGFLVEAAAPSDTANRTIRPSFATGDLWCGYRIVESLHCMIDSEVYRVHAIRSGKPRVLKIMQGAFPHPEMAVAVDHRLRQEFALLGRIHHPNVVELIEEGVVDGRRYGILEWIDGPSVAAHVRDPAIRDVDGTLLALAQQCVRALQVVHSAGYLHGDVHPGNFLTDGRRVCLIDFGLSRPIDIAAGDESNITEGGVVSYLPPEYALHVLEQRRGLWGSVAGEVYSCAVVLFVLFTRELPYALKTYREEYLQSILTEPPRPFAACGRRAWPEVERNLRRAMAKNSQDRFPSMRAFLAALRRAERGLAGSDAAGVGVRASTAATWGGADR
jgi:eukaryotic-like serine/threonine-protein kinase